MWSLIVLFAVFCLYSGNFVFCQSARPYVGPPVIPVILPGGFIAETQEVARAREAHLNLFAKAAQPTAVFQPFNNVHQQQQYSQQGYPQQVFTGSQGQVGYYAGNQQIPQQSSYRGPPVVPVLLPSGHIAETQEVVLARRNQLRLLAQVQQRASTFNRGEGASQSQRQWQGPAAVTVLLPSGHLADTPEVADAKVYHLQQLLNAAKKSKQISTLM